MHIFVYRYHSWVIYSFWSQRILLSPDSKLQRTDSVPHSAAGSATAAAAECGPTTNLAEAPPTARLRRSGAGKQAPVRRRLAGAGPELGLQMRASIFILYVFFTILPLYPMASFNVHLLV